MVGPLWYTPRVLTFRRVAVTGYLPVVIYLGLIVAFAVVSLGMAAVLRPSRPYASKLENYECGAEPIGEAWVQFPGRASTWSR